MKDFVDPTRKLVRIGAIRCVENDVSSIGKNAWIDRDPLRPSAINEFGKIRATDWPVC
jgi:hypothetical protein